MSTVPNLENTPKRSICIYFDIFYLAFLVVVMAPKKDAKGGGAKDKGGKAAKGGGDAADKGNFLF